MRKTFVKELLKIIDEDTYFLTADVGYGVLEPLKEALGDRFINVGISEQAMISIASGLALAGKEVYTYTMCAFYLRAVEQIKLDLCYQDAAVTMIGVGTGFDYEFHGTTHYALEDDEVIGALRNIEVVTPENKKDLKKLLREPLVRPRYIRLTRFGEQSQGFTDTLDTRKYPKYVGDLQYMLKKDYEHGQHPVSE